MASLFVRIKNTVCFIPLIILAACQVEQPPEESTVKQAKHNFVGGAVVNHNRFMILKESISNQLAFVLPNKHGLAEFHFSNIDAGEEFNIEFFYKDQQLCTLENNKGVYSGFPFFATKILCADDDNIRYSGNPIIRDSYSADPTLLAQGDTLYLYAGKDEASLFHLDPARSQKDFPFALINMLQFNITGIHIYKTRNMVDWEYVAPAIEADSSNWMHQTFASHIIEHNGKYYLYTCSPVTGLSIVEAAFSTILNFLRGDFAIAAEARLEIGVAVSDSPEGPFVDMGPFIKQKTDNTGVGIMDPSVLVDHDGQAYIFFGSHEPKYAKLGNDMMSLDGPVLDVTLDNGEDIPDFFEAAYIHQRNNKYYFSYSASPFGSRGPIKYAMADNINGPWTEMGDVLGAVNIQTNHAAITEFKGQDYVFYHTGHLPGISFLGSPIMTSRAVSVDKLEYNADGSIQTVEQTRVGVPEI